MCDIVENTVFPLCLFLNLLINTNNLEKCLNDPFHKTLFSDNQNNCHLCLYGSFHKLSFAYILSD